jgi:hypothetical protein
VIPALLNFSLNASNDPKVEDIASASSPFGVPPALGARLSQKKVWFQWPPPLLRTAGLMLPAEAINSSSDLFSFGVPAIALLRLST